MKRRQQPLSRPDEGSSDSKLSDDLLSDKEESSLLPPTNTNTFTNTNKKLKGSKQSTTSLFSAVMSRSQKSNVNRREPSANIIADNANKQPKMISTPKRNKMGGGNIRQRSPMHSPGGYEILKALDTANVYAYEEKDKHTEEDADNNVRPADEFHDAKVYFNNHDDNDEKSSSRTNMKQDLSSPGTFLESSIVEATQHAFDIDSNDNMQQKHNMNTSKACHPEPCAVGVIDWSLKRRIRLDCSPGKCLPNTHMSYDEGLIRQLAIQYLSNGGSNIDIKSSNNNRSKKISAEEMAAAKWLASTMYYQHPAVHPLPSSLLTSDSSEGASGSSAKGSRGDLSSYILQPHSVHNKVRLPGIGSMGGLGNSSIPTIDKGDKATAASLGNQDKRSKYGKTSVATISSLLYQRRRDWQEAFRSMYQCWKSKLKDIDSSAYTAATKKGHGSSSFFRRSGETTIPSQDDIARCSFYSILPHQVVLFRGGSNTSNSIVPMIVFSSTTPYLRSKLRSMGVDLRLFTRKDGSSDYELFSETMLDNDSDETTIAEDAESVHAELNAIKHADDEKGKVTVEVKKRKQRPRYDAATMSSRTNTLPPLFVSGEDDCAAVYELFMNTYGLSAVVQETEGGKTNAVAPIRDVPLLLCRSLGSSCTHTTLRTLSLSSRRDCAYMNQAYGNSTAGGTLIQQQHLSSGATAKATMELRGPILPCALRDLTCAAVNLMLLDKSKQGGSRPLGSINDVSTASSHQFAMFMQAYDGERSISTVSNKATGSSSSIHFNGSGISLLPRQEDHDIDADASTAWHECRQGDCINVLVWDISRKSVVSFHSLEA